MLSRRFSTTSMIKKSLFTLAALMHLACSDKASAGVGTTAGVEASAGVGASGDAEATAGAGQSAGSEASSGSGGSVASVAGMGGEVDDDHALIVPQGLDVIQRPGLNSVFDVIALTLRQGSGSLLLYAAVRNDGSAPSCNPSFSVELHDSTGDVIAAGISGLLVPHAYKLTDGSDMIAGCIAPGEVTMTAIEDGSLAVALEDVTQVVYGSSYWTLGVVPVSGMSLSDVQAVTQGDGVSYTGTLVNGLDTALGNPSVEVFPLNSVGRPLGLARAGNSVAVAPGGSWAFQTDTVNVTSTDFAAFPTGTP